MSNDQAGGRRPGATAAGLHRLKVKSIQSPPYQRPGRVWMSPSQKLATALLTVSSLLFLKRSSRSARSLTGSPFSSISPTSKSYASPGNSRSITFAQQFLGDLFIRLCRPVRRRCSRFVSIEAASYGRGSEHLVFLPAGALGVRRSS